MKTVNQEEIIKIFNLLNVSSLDYILIRNINSELPDKLKSGKDIDILVKKEQKNRFINFLKKNNYCQIPHPFKNDAYLYGADKFIFFYNKKNDILFDLNFQLVCRSLNAGEWIPLDQQIQNSIWENKKFIKNNNFSSWFLDDEDEFLMLVVRSVFDKKEFQAGYIQRIGQLYKTIDIKKVEEKMKSIFFKYTPYLLSQINDKQYKEIIDNYIKFREY
jgi:hypothetical protein